MNFLITILTLLFVALSFDARSDEDSVNQQDWIARQQEQESEMEEKLSAKEEDDLDDNEILISIDENSANCPKINNVNINSAKILSPKQQMKLTKKFVGQCFDNQTINKLLSVIENYYSKKGHKISQILLPIQDSQLGKIELEVVEDKIS